MADGDSNIKQDTPEKRLLKLIEDPSSGESAEKPAKKGPRWQELLSPQTFKIALESLKAKASGLFQQAKISFDLKTINRLLGILIVVVGIIFFINTLYEMKTLSTDVLGEDMATPPQADIITHDLTDYKSSWYQSPEAKNVFLPFGKRTKPEIVEKKDSSLRLVEMTKNLKLTGISYNPVNPEQAFCMVEDLEKNITIFLRQGDAVAGLAVKQINPNTVVLEFQGETIEIR